MLQKVGMESTPDCSHCVVVADDIDGLYYPLLVDEEGELRILAALLDVVLVVGLNTDLGGLMVSYPDNKKEIQPGAV